MLVAQHMHDVEKLRRELEQLQQVLFRTDSIIREFDVEIRSVESELSIVQKGQLGSANIGAQLANEKEELLNRHQSVQGKLQSIQQEVSTLERLATDRRNEEETLMNRNNDLREQLAVLREQKTHQQSLLNDMEVTQQQLETKIHSLEKDLALYMEHEKGIDSTPEEINEQLHIATTKKSTVEASLTQERENKARISGLLLQQEEHLKDLRHEEAELVSSLNALHVALSRLEVKYETVTNRLLDEYGLYPDFDEEVQFDVEQARIRVDELKEELYTLGPVNPSAIEEYEEVAQRHAFLTEQRNDLVEAKNTLNEAMSEMDREMEVRFGATFNAVKSRFHHVFKEMFGGGEADLILTQPDNLLETGVDIIARPPGKKLQNLSLLSGGERALTAITLLFSIIEVRPVPFCILDEVEAALDEANVIRYSKYLKRFSDNTQFIVITHRKGTMEGADVLYGITMQESGVSKLISVKLSEVPAEMLN